MTRGTSREQTIAQYLRMRRVFWRGAMRVLMWGLLSYAFVLIYTELYGPSPVLVERLGTTLAVLCGVIGGSLVLMAVLAGSISLLSKWRYRRGTWI